MNPRLVDLFHLHVFRPAVHRFVWAWPGVAAAGGSPDCPAGKLVARGRRPLVHRAGVRMIACLADDAKHTVRGIAFPVVHA